MAPTHSSIATPRTPRAASSPRPIATRSSTSTIPRTIRIDLRPIDARIGGDNQKFDFIGTADFTGKKGELRYFVNSGNAIVQADISGDRKADVEIKLNDVSSLVAGDFYL